MLVLAGALLAPFSVLVVLTVLRRTALAPVACLEVLDNTSAGVAVCHLFPLVVVLSRLRTSVPGVPIYRWRRDRHGGRLPCLYFSVALPCCAVFVLLASGLARGPKEIGMQASVWRTGNLFVSLASVALLIVLLSLKVRGVLRLPYSVRPCLE